MIHVIIAYAAMLSWADGVSIKLHPNDIPPWVRMGLIGGWSL